MSDKEWIPIEPDMVITKSNNKNKTDSEIKTTIDSASATDVIYRKQAIDAVKRLSLGETDALRLALRIEDYLERLPSAQPEHPLLKIIQDFKEATGCKEILVVQKDAMKAWDENGVAYTMQPEHTGEWIPLRGDDGLNIGGGKLIKFNGEQVYYCSECKVCKYKSSGGFIIPVVIKFPHCPNCGADMRGEEA